MNKEFFHLPRHISLRWNDYSLRTKLVLAFLIIALLPIGVQFFQNNGTMRQLLTNSASTALSGAAAQTASRYDAFLAEGLIDVETAAQSHIWEEYLALSPTERAGSESEQVLYIDLRGLASHDKNHIDSVGLMDKNGVDVADTTPGEIGIDKSTHRYVAEPFRTGLPYSTIQFSPTSHKLSVYFSAPVRDDNGNVIGVLRIRYNAAVLQQIVTQSRGDVKLEGGELILLDENHIRLAVSDRPDLILKSVVPLPTDKLTKLQAEFRLPSNQSSEALSTNLPEFEQGLKNAANEPSFIAETHPEEETTIKEAGEQLVVARLKNQPWLIVAAQPEAIYLAPITQENREDFIFILITVLLVAMAAVIISQSISAPLIKLTKVAQQITGGDLAAQAPVTSKDETGQLANAFNNMTSRLRKSLEDLDHRAKATATMAEVSRRISMIMDRQKLIDEVIERLSSTFNYYHTQIYFYDPTGNELVLAGGTGEAGKALLERGHKIIKGNGLVGRAAETNSPVLVSDVSKDRDWLPNPLLPETKSEIAIPISSGDVVIGVLDVQQNKAGGLTKEDGDILQSIASQIMIAAQNGRLLLEAQKQAERESLISSINQKIQSTTTVKSALQIAVRELGQALGSQASVRLAQTSQRTENK